MPPSYTRYWDLHLTGKGGFYEFNALIKEQLDYQTEADPPDRQGGRRYPQRQEAARFARSLNLITPEGLKEEGVIQNRPLHALPPVGGYVASMFDLNKLATTPRFKDPTLRSLVEWINAGDHKGKLRINCHCDGMGRLGMGDQKTTNWWGRKNPETVTWVDAAHLVETLVENGLAALKDAPTADSAAGPKKNKGLVTISLAVCMGARYAVTPATGTSAPGSAIDQVIRGLRAYRMTGVEVTGSNEITMMSSTRVPGQLGRVLGIGHNQFPNGWDPDPGNPRDPDPANHLPTVGIPAPFNVNVAANTIDVPAGWTVTPAKDNTNEPSRGWVLAPGPGQPSLDPGKYEGKSTCEIPKGWIVDTRTDPTRPVIRPPLGWVLTSRGPNQGGSLTANQGTFDCMWERLAHSPAKVRQIS